MITREPRIPAVRPTRRPPRQREVIGLFGQPVSENPTGTMLEAALRCHGLDWVYLSFEVAPGELGAAVNAARTLQFRGFHCTIPHKETVIQYLDSIGDSAVEIGAVNCVIRTSEGLVGENTDGRGFLDALDDDAVAHSSVLIFGAGGAARAIGVELVLAGVRNVTLVNRTRSRADTLAAHLHRVAKRHGRHLSVRTAYWGDAFAVDPGTDLVVNATSLGLYPDVDTEFPIAAGSLNSSMVVADVIANPRQTDLLRTAERVGCTTVNGAEMLANQGARSLRYWAGIEADKSVMRAALNNAIGLPETAAIIDEP